MLNFHQTTNTYRDKFQQPHKTKQNRTGNARKTQDYKSLKNIEAIILEGVHIEEARERQIAINVLVRLLLNI